MVRKVMFLCAHNQTRSVAGEGLLTGEKGFDVKSRALWRGTKRKVTKADGAWADEVYVMMPGMVPVAVEAGIPRRKVHALWIPDNYMMCERSLLRALKTQLEPYNIHIKKSMEQAQKDCYKISDRKMGFSFGRRMFDWEWEPSMVTVGRGARSFWGTDEAMELDEEERKQKRAETELQYPFIEESVLLPDFRTTAERVRDFKRAQMTTEPEEKSRSQVLAEFEEAEAYVKAKQAEREKERMAEKQKKEVKLLQDLEKYTKSIKELFKER